MPKFDHAAVAVNAAGIANALACLEGNVSESQRRFERVTDDFGGHFGIIQQVVEAAEIMERFRMKHSANAMWGGELPYLYDVWDAVARALFEYLGSNALDVLVQTAIKHAVVGETSRT